jgi:hypothetical protein
LLKGRGFIIQMMFEGFGSFWRWATYGWIMQASVKRRIRLMTACLGRTS